MLANKLAKSYVEKGFVSVSYEAKNVKRPKDLERTRCQRVRPPISTSSVKPGSAESDGDD